MIRIRTLQQFIRYSSRPVLIAPWRSELGTELLYWLPYLEWLLQGIPEERIWAVGRGGPREWYRAHAYLDLYAMASVESVRKEALRAASKTGSIKPSDITPWDRQMVRLAAKRFGLEHPIVVWPSTMVQAFDPWWKLQRPFAEILQYLSYPPLNAPPEVPGLPERFFCVRFYHRYTFNAGNIDGGALRTMMQKIVDGLSERAPVVNLAVKSTHYDDHMDFPLENVITVNEDSVKDDENVAVQASIMARSQGFVGVYGGMQKMALRYGIPSLGLYTQWGGTMIAHRFLCEHIATQLRIPFQVQDALQMGNFSMVWDRLSSRARSS